MKEDSSLFTKYLKVLEKHGISTKYQLMIVDKETREVKKKKEYDHKIYNGNIMYEFIKEEVPTKGNWNPLVKDFKIPYLIKLINFINVIFKVIFKKTLFKYPYVYDNPHNKFTIEKSHVILLNKEKTRRLRKKAKEIGVYFPFYINSIVNQFLIKELMHENSIPKYFLMPYPKNKNLTPIGNDFRFYEFEYVPVTKPKKIIKSVEKAFKQESYLRVNLEMFFIHLIDRVFPKLFYKKLNKMLGENNGRLSIMTYFGQGYFENKNFIVDGKNLLTNFHPIHIGFGILNSELMLSFNVHPRYIENEERLMDLHSKLEKILLEIIDG